MARRWWDEKRRLWACEGKAAFVTYTEAEQRARRRARRKGGGYDHPYHCQICQRYHLGGRSLKRPSPLKEIGGEYDDDEDGYSLPAPPLPG